MKLISLKCPNCNSTMQTDDSAKEVYCSYCGTKFAIDDEVKHIQYDNAEQAGYEFEKGRQRAIEEQQARNSVPDYVQYQPPKKRKTWLWVLGWLFFFPIPLTVIIVRSQSLSKKAKIIILSILWAVILLLGIFGETEQTTATPTTKTGFTQVIQTNQYDISELIKEK